MDRSTLSIPKAFVSYSWDDDRHRMWVLDLATRLRHDGVAVTLDQWHVGPGDQLTSFMEQAVRENDFVLIICTPKYKHKSDNRTGGVGYEGDVMTGEILTARNDKKFIPILRKGDWVKAAPSWLLSKVYIDMRGSKYSEQNYSALLITLHQQKSEAPPIGAAPSMKVLGSGANATHDQITTKARKLIVEILSNTYRRAFSLNFTTRFATPGDYRKVLNSIHSCHSFLQKKMVHVMIECPKKVADILLDMLRQLEYMDTIFRQMEPYTRGESSQETNNYLAGRVDGTGQPELMRAFIEMEKVRIEFVVNNMKLSKAAHIPLPSVPATEINMGTPFGVSQPLTIEDLERVSAEFHERHVRYLNKRMKK